MQKKYRCSACHKEFTSEEAEDLVTLHDPATGFTLCRECFNKMGDDDKRHYAMRHPEQALELMSGDDSSEVDVAAQAAQTKQDLNRYQRIVASTSPEDIKNHLDEFIIGQDHAKETLSVAVYNHYKRLAYSAMLKQKKQMGYKVKDSMPLKVQKSNIILLGPSGVGKTAILEAIADYLDVPFAITSSTTLTSSGYVGSDPESCIQKLYLAAGKNIAKTEGGIVFLDEFDKLARKSGANNMITTDPGHEGVQQALLKIIEGSDVDFMPDSKRKNPNAPTVHVNTENILFIVGGAFEGIENIIEDRLDLAGGSFGFNQEDEDEDKLSDDAIDRYNELIDKVSAEDLKEYGIITEIVGRLPIICPLHQLKEEDMVRILIEPRNAIIKQYAVLFSMDHCSLKFKKDALNEIAHRALETKTGARALKTIVENILLRTMYKLPTIMKSSKSPGYVLITKELVKNPEEIKVTFPAAEEKACAN